jgi:type III secretory pathway component EscR
MPKRRKSTTENDARYLVVVIGVICLLYGITTFANNMLLGIIAIVLGCFLVALPIEPDIAREFGRFLIEIFSSILNFVRQKTEEKEASEKKTLKRRDWIADTTISIDGDDYETFTLSLKRNEKVEGEVSGDDIINVYLVNRYALNKFERDEDEGFTYFDGQENAKRTRINFTPSKSGQYYLIVWNEGKEETTVDVKLYSTKEL